MVILLIGFSSIFNISFISNGLLFLYDRFWMYRNSPQELYREDYCKEIQDFINFILSNLNNISGGGIRCPYVKCKIKKFHQSNFVTTIF